MLITQDVLIEEIISKFWENIYSELFSFSIKRAARRGCDIFTHQVSQWRSCEFFFVLFYILFRRKKTGFAWTNIVLRQILTVFIKIIKLSTVFPNIPFAECGRYDFMIIFNIARKQVMGGDCAALYAYEEVQGKNNCMTTSWTAVLLVKLSYSIIFSTEDRKQRDRKRYQSWKR